MVKIDVDLSDLMIRGAEYDADAEGLLKSIILLLRSKDSNAGHRRIADMLDPDADTIYRLTLGVRPNLGTPQQRKQHEKTRDELVEVYRNTKNPRNFVSRAVAATGLSRQTIASYRKEVERLAAALDAIDQENADEIRRSRMEALERICAAAPNDDAAIYDARKALGMSEDGVRKYLARRKVKNPM
jgi:hypothetical protein